MPIPRTYMQPGEGAIASYDFTDIAEGTGTVQFYGLRGENVSGASIFYSLVKTITFTDEINAGMLIAGDGAVNFDTSPFNLPKVIKGTLYLTGTHYAVASSYVRFTIQKVSGSDVITLAPADESKVVDTERVIFMKFDIPSTKFKKGDILRIVVQVFGDTGNRGLNLNSLSATYDPFKIWVPFRIDL